LKQNKYNEDEENNDTENGLSFTGGDVNNFGLIKSQGRCCRELLS